MTAFKKLSIKPKTLLLIVVVLAIGIWLGNSISSEASKTQIASDQTDTKTQLWTCSMHPQIKLPKPGLCPICNMQLIPLIADEAEKASSDRQLTVSETAKKLMDIEVAPVERKFVNAVVRMTGKVDFDETNLAYITARVPGRLDRLFVDYTGVPVNKGDHLVYLYSPELISAQQELLQAVEAAENIQKTELGIMQQMTEATAQAAREKLLLWGLTPEQMAGSMPVAGRKTAVLLKGQDVRAKLEMSKAEEQLLSFMIVFPEHTEAFLEAGIEDVVQGHSARVLLHHIKELADRKNSSGPEQLLAVTVGPEREFVSRQLISAPDFPEQDRQAEAQEKIRWIKESKLKVKMKQLTSKINQAERAGDGDLLLELLAEKNKISEMLQEN